MIGDLKENVIEWYTGSDRATVTFSQRKYINRLRKLLSTGVSGVEIIAENQDGSITAHIPLHLVRLTNLKRKTVDAEGVEDEDNNSAEKSE